MRSILLLPALLCVATPAQTELARLTVADASAFSAYGSSVAIDGDVLLVGAPDDAVPNNYTGSVYVFRRNGGTWTREAKLVASDGMPQDRFGRSLALEGNVAVIGAPATLGNTTGAVYVFRYDGSTWVEEQKLTGLGWWFGNSVALQGNRIVVGAMWTRLPGVGWGTNHAGSAWVFEHDGTSWNMTQQLLASDPDTSDLFGSAVGLDGNTILVGARGEGDNNIGRYYIGAVYAFDFDGQAWNQVQKFRADQASDQAQFGRALALSGDAAVVGAPYKSSRSGVAYAFRRVAGTWTQEDKLRSPWPGSFNEFGHALALQGDYMLAADYGRDTAGNLGGAVYAYRYANGKWRKEPAFTGSQSVDGEQFCIDVALDGTSAAVAGWEVNAPPASDGVGYVFDVSEHFHLMVSPLPLEPANDGKLIVRNAPPNAPVLVAYSLWGRGTTSIPLLGLTLGLASPGQLGTIELSNNQGNVQWEYPLPAAATGLSIWLQALHLGAVTNVIAANVL